MTYRDQTLRPAMTAIAAVIALSSTPLLAQSVETPAPIVDATPAPAADAPDPLAPEPTVTETTSTPEPVASETTAAPPAATRARTSSARTTARARPVARSTNVARPAAAAPAATAAPVVAPTPMETPPAEPLAVAPGAMPPPPVDPAAEAPPVAIETMSMDEALPIAGAAGLGLLALLGAGFVMRRRRRRQEDAIHEAKWQQIEAAPESAFEPEPMPTFVRTPVAAATAGAASDLPEGFDVSRFGPHVQSAYRGPTPDNPSLSLKRRLTVGHFLDQKAAEAGGSAAPVTASNEPAKAQPARPAWAASTNNDFLLRRADKKVPLRPAYQK